MLEITASVAIADEEVELHAIRAQGAGGQHVNKVASAVHLRFDIQASSLPEAFKALLLASHDSRISKTGVIIIKAQQHRTLQQNRSDALNRLQLLIKAAIVVPKKRKATRRSRSSINRRLENKTNRGLFKSLRKRVTEA